MIAANKTYDELRVGDTAEIRRLCTTDDIFIFANASGNHNPMHMPDYDPDGDGHPDAVAPSMWIGSLISATLGNALPGAGTLYLSQTFRFVGRAHAGDELIAKVSVLEKGPDLTVRLATEVTQVATGALVLDGEALVRAPSQKIHLSTTAIPGLTVQSHRHFDALIARAEPLPPLITAVVSPEEANSLGGALSAARHTIITPILIGARALIEAAARDLGEDLTGIEIIDVPDQAEAATRAVALINAGQAQALMKGHLHTDTLLGAVVKREGGLRTGRRLTHVFVMDVPGLDHLLLISDAAINIAPDLETKIDIVQNAIDLGRALGIALPRVGVLSAVETVNPKIPSSMDAALLSKMAERGQITGGLVDGPLAMDNAIDIDAARTKGIKSLVAGRAEILIAPNLDAGNMMAKQLTYMAHAESGGIVLGARVPIILTSRADNDTARLASCAVAALHHAWSTGLSPEQFAEAAQ